MRGLSGGEIKPATMPEMMIKKRSGTSSDLTRQYEAYHDLPAIDQELRNEGYLDDDGTSNDVTATDLSGITEIRDPILRRQAFRHDIGILERTPGFLLPHSGSGRARMQREYPVIRHPTAFQIMEMVQAFYSSQSVSLTHNLSDPYANKYRAIYTGALMDMNSENTSEYNDYGVTTWLGLSPYSKRSNIKDARKAVIALSMLRHRYAQMKYLEDHHPSR